MKKIISTIALVLVCAISSQAQDKKAAPVTSAIAAMTETEKQNSNQDPKQKAYEIVKYLGLNESYIEQFYGLLSMKQEILSNPEYSQERKTIVIESIKEKLKASLDAKSYEKLLANKELYSSFMAKPAEAKK